MANELSFMCATSMNSQLKQLKAVWEEEEGMHVLDITEVLRSGYLKVINVWL
jgi:hypothetical protein